MERSLWKTLDEDEDDQTLPIIQIQQTLQVTEIKETTDQTQPPAYFNEGYTLSAMENPVKFMQASSKTLNETLKNTGGLGTVATRADIIDKLFNTFLIEKRGQDIHVTAKGRQLLSLVPNDLRYPELTAKWELELLTNCSRKETITKIHTRHSSIYRSYYSRNQ